MVFDGIVLSNDEENLLREMVSCDTPVSLASSLRVFTGRIGSADFCTPFPKFSPLVLKLSFAFAFSRVFEFQKKHLKHPHISHLLLDLSI